MIITRQFRRGALAWAFALVAAPASAQLSFGVGIEHFAWTEDTSPSVRERGFLPSFWVQLHQEKPSGWIAGYQLKFFVGDVTYRGSTLFPPVVPVESTTHYTGMSNELQARYRDLRASGNRIALVTGVGLDVWRRELSAFQKEDFTIGFARLGLELEFGAESERGWILAAGLKYPFYTDENAYLTDIGFDQNPRLRPGKKFTYSAHAGYRPSRDMRIIVYTDGYRFGESPAVPVSIGGAPVGAVFQPASTMRVFGIRLEHNFR